LTRSSRDRPQLQVWGWEESSECGRQIDVLHWSLEFLLARGLPIPTAITEPLIALMFQWGEELDSIDPAVVAAHEATADQYAGVSPRAQGSTVPPEGLPRAAELSEQDHRIVGSLAAWGQLDPKQRNLLILRLAICYRRESGLAIPSGLVQRFLDAARDDAIDPSVESTDVEGSPPIV